MNPLKLRIPDQLNCSDIAKIRVINHLQDKTESNTLLYDKFGRIVLLVQAPLSSFPFSI